MRLYDFSKPARGIVQLRQVPTTTGNRLEYDGTYTYTYDDEGNTLTKVGGGQYWEYAWDFRNRLIEAVNHTGSLGGAIVYEADYTYDVFDRRIGILEDTDGTGGSATVQSWTLYDGANAWEDFNSGGTLTMRYLNGPGMDERYARKTSGGANSWYLTDNVNSVRQIVGTTGTVGYSASYSAFGGIASQSGAGGDRFKYTGREWDSGTGQYFYRARYYGADVGRFKSEDPIGFAGGDANLTRYASNSPTNFRDASGLQPRNDLITQLKRELRQARLDLAQWERAIRSKLRDIEQDEQTIEALFKANPGLRQAERDIVFYTLLRQALLPYILSLRDCNPDAFNRWTEYYNSLGDRIDRLRTKFSQQLEQLAELREQIALWRRELRGLEARRDATRARIARLLGQLQQLGVTNP